MPHLLSTLPALLLTGCLLAGDNLPPDDVPTDTSRIVVDDTCGGALAAVGEVALEGDELVVTATYAGCAATRVWACWDGAFLESFPVQAPIAIRHEAAPGCDERTETHRFSIEPVLDAYLDAYGQMDPIILRLGERSVTWQP